MEIKNRFKCVPDEMFERIRAFSEKLWDEKNPAAVELSSIMQEFEEEMISVNELLEKKNKTVKEKIVLAEREFAEKYKALEAEISDLKDEKKTALAEIGALIDENNTLLSKLKVLESENARIAAQVAEEKVKLVSEFAAKTRKFYENMKAREEEMLAKWEEKNSQLEDLKISLEKEYKGKMASLMAKEQLLEEEFKIKKSELIRTFDRVRAELELKEKELLQKQEKENEKDSSSPGSALK